MKWDFKSNSKIIYLYVFSSVLLIVIPDNTFYKYPALKPFFITLSKFIPAFHMFKEYSSFPDVSMLVYFFDALFFLIFLFVPLYRQLKVPADRYSQWKKKPIFSFFVTPIILMSTSIGLFLFFPGTPSHAGGPPEFIDHVVYTSKIGFALGTTTMLGAQFLCLMILAKFITYTMKHVTQPIRR